MSKQSGKVSSVALFLVSIVIIGGILGGIGYWYGKKNAGKNNQSSTTQNSTDATKLTAKDLATDTTQKPCASSAESTTFYNKLIGLEFCYPKEWGETTLGDVPASASSKGLAYEITFTKNIKVTIASATTDYINTIGRGGRCADPVTAEPDFSSFNTAWKVEGKQGDIQSATRDTIKKDGVYIAREHVDDFDGNVCLTGYVSIGGGAYTVITANMQAPYGNGITTVKAHVDNPTILLSPTERVQFGEMIDSIKKAS